jgi:hypothetical protein
MSSSGLEGASATPVRLTDDELDRLAADPRNRVFRQSSEKTRDAWDMEVLEPLFRAAHGTFVIMASSNPDKSDEILRQEMICAAKDKMKDAIRDHPMLFAKLTTRSIATNQQKMRALWMMFSMHKMIQSGEAGETEAQKAFAQTVLPVCLSQPPVD